MTLKFVVAHRKDPNNVGDIASNPLQYFLKPDEYQTIDVANLQKEVYPTDVPLILGGGGLIANEFFGNVTAKLLDTPDRLQLAEMQKSWKLVDKSQDSVHGEFKQRYTEAFEYAFNNLPTVSAPRYAWGVGHNSNDVGDPTYPEELINYAAVGIRDYNVGFDWAPCASCMHPALRKKYKTKNPVIWFEHKKQLIKDRVFGQHPIPRFINSGNNIEQTIELLGSAETILTNSYHGAYWGTLLGRRVIVVGPWSSKFHYMRHRPSMITADQDWQEVVDSTPVYTDALDECAAATEEFWNRIK